jgi:hypothetical protein
VINVAQSQNATIVMGLSFLMTTRMWPEWIEGSRPRNTGRFEFLLQEVLREIKNMPTQGMTESEEAIRKRTALDLVGETIAVTWRHDLDSNDEH